MRNWSETIRLLLPLKLRGCRKLRLLLAALTRRDVADAEAAEVEKERVKAEHDYLGQEDIAVRLLRERFGDRRIVIGEEATDHVVIVSERGGDREVWCGGGEKCVLTVSESGVPDRGLDFVVHMTRGGDVDGVRAWLKRYVMAGIRYDVLADIDPNVIPIDDDGGWVVIGPVERDPTIEG